MRFATDHVPRLVWVALLAAVLGRVAPGLAEGPAPGSESTARRVIEATVASDAGALEKQAALLHVDAFLVVDDLIHASEAVLGWPAGAAPRWEAAAAYVARVEALRPAVGRLQGWLERLRTAHAQGGAAASPLRERLKAYRAGAPQQSGKETRAAEEARWRSTLPSLEGDPAAMLLAAEVAARWEGEGQSRELEPLAQALVDEARRAGWRQLEGRALGWLAMALSFLRRDLDARAHAEQEVEVWRSLGREDRAAYALQRVADSSHQLGDLPAMQEALDEAQALHARVGDGVGAARVLRQRAGLAWRRGENAVALDLFEQAVDLARQQGLAPNLANVLTDRASMWAGIGQHDRALTDGREARAILESTGNARDAAAGPMVLGVLLHRGGQQPEARDALTLAVERFRAAHLPREAAEASMHLATVLTALGDASAAMALIERTQADLEALGDRSTLGGLRMAWSDALWQLGKREEAILSLVAAEADFEAVGERQHVATVLGNRGLLLARVARHKESRECFALAIEEWTRLQVPEMVARNVERQAVSNLELGMPMRALKDVRRCLDLRCRLGIGLGDSEAAGGAVALHDVLGVGMDAAIRALRTATTSAPRILDDAAWFAESGSGLLLSRGLKERQALLHRRVPAELAQADARAHERVRVALSAMAVRRVAPASARAELDAAYLELEAVVARVQREGRRVAELVYPKPRTRAEIEAALPDGAALVHLHVGSAAGAAVVVRRAGTEVIAFDARELADETAELLHRLQAGEASEAELAERLYARLITPLEPALRGVKRLILCPDGPLHLLPFAVLRRTLEGKVELLGERFEISYAPSGTVLLWLLEARKEAPAARGVVALGDPVYPSERRGGAAPPIARRGPVRGSIASLARLPETGEEARALAERFPPNERVLLLREAASREGLVDALSTAGRCRSLHLACHALLDVARPRLSGVALAGGDLLTADDVDRMDVPADLVVLSACETGRGRIERGEGVAGLTRSFLLAGASRVLVSLWKVDDRATRLLMGAFYEALIERQLPASQALARAQRAVREHGERSIDREASRSAGRDVYVTSRPYEAPVYWAAWCLWGLHD